MDVGTPQEFQHDIIKLLESKWATWRKSYTILEAEQLAGKLGHLAETAPWLRHLMSHLYTSIASGLNHNKTYLINSNTQFREWLKLCKATPSENTPETHIKFAQSKAEKRVHKC